MVGLAGTVTISKQLIVAALPRAALLGRRGWLRCRRTLAALRLFARGGLRYASSAPRLYVAAGEQRQLLRADLALRTAADVANTLGAMKGVMMKLGQMASYVDDGLAPGVRRTLARLQDSVPPMRQELAAAVVEEELGTPPERAFARWDPQPIAAASIGQVHRALTLDGRAVAVKVQYPGIAQMMAADLRNVGLLRRIVRITAPAQDVDALLTELRDRVLEELDYRREAVSQQAFAAYYRGHPTIHVPRIISELSTSRIVTRSPVAQYISIPQSYVILQRINLGLFAVLGELAATANWRAISEEIWPFAQGPASTPMGEAEAAWRARGRPIAA
jgi:predicted unusual protein kinase regulating ubiquinone biosynthesis (AarF/ABC1/UbiB family)